MTVLYLYRSLVETFSVIHKDCTSLKLISIFSESEVRGLITRGEGSFESMNLDSIIWARLF